MTKLELIFLCVRRKSPLYIIIDSRLIFDECDDMCRRCDDFFSVRIKIIDQKFGEIFGIALNRNVSELNGITLISLENKDRKFVNLLPLNALRPH